MKFIEMKLAGAYLIEPELVRDQRGFFARMWCEREFHDRGLDKEIAQISISYNETRGTIRGLHFQVSPNEEVKLVRCTSGAIFDVIVDVRPESPTHLQWASARLRAEERNMLYVPKGFAHGFQTLEDRTEVLYQISTFHAAESARGIRFDDAALRIEWPLEVSVISDRDISWASIDPAPMTRL